MVRSRWYTVHCVERYHALSTVPPTGALLFTGDHNSDRVLDTLLKEGRGAVDVTGLGEFPFGDGDRVGHEVVLA